MFRGQSTFSQQEEQKAVAVTSALKCILTNFFDSDADMLKMN
jgi:hypothetical protein